MAPRWQDRAVQLIEAQQRHVFTRQALAHMLEQHRNELGAPPSLTTGRFIEALERTGRLAAKPIRRIPSNRLAENAPSAYDPNAVLATRSRGSPRYIWDDASTFEVALTMRTGSYLSHASAVFLHGLTDQLPRTVYVNKEQSPKPRPTGQLSQQSIDRSFNSRPRSSNYMFLYENTRFVLLSGKHTGNLEVTELADSYGVPVRVTKLERTLIDIVVRPTYSGGVFEVLAAYRGARERASASTLLAVLKKLNYIYPYHQAVGFYLERAGYPSQALARFEQLPREFNFYLTHQTVNPKYDSKWQIYYPAELD